MHLRLRDLERGLRGGLVAGLDRRLDLLDEGAHPAQPRAVGRGAFLGLAKPFLGGSMMRHAASSGSGGAGL